MDSQHKALREKQILYIDISKRQKDRQLRKWRGRNWLARVFVCVCACVSAWNGPGGRVRHSRDQADVVAQGSQQLLGAPSVEVQRRQRVASSTGHHQEVTAQCKAGPAQGVQLGQGKRESAPVTYQDRGVFYLQPLTHINRAVLFIVMTTLRVHRESMCNSI